MALGFIAVAIKSGDTPADWPLLREVESSSLLLRVRISRATIGRSGKIWGDTKLFGGGGVIVKV